MKQFIPILIMVLLLTGCRRQDDYEDAVRDQRSPGIEESVSGSQTNDVEQ